MDLPAEATNYQMNQSVLRVPFWKTFVLIIVVVSAIRVETVASVEPSAAKNVTGTVVAVTINCLSVAASLCAGVAQDTCYYRAVRAYHYARPATANSSARADGNHWVVYFSNQKVIWGTEMPQPDFLSELDKLVLEGDKLQLWWGRDGRRIRHLWQNHWAAV